MTLYTHPDLPGIHGNAAFTLGEVQYPRVWWRTVSPQKISGMGFLIYEPPEPEPPTLDERKTLTLAAIRDRRWQCETSGITANGAPNIVLALSIYNPSLGAQRSAYAAEGNLASWANANFDATTSASRAFFVLGHWYAGSGDDWLVSEGAAGTPGVGGWTPVAVAWDDETVTVGYEHEGRAFVHYGNGKVAFSDDGETFTVAPNPDLAARPYFACAA